MKVIEFERTDGSKGTKNIPEVGDTYKSNFSLVKLQHNIAEVEGEPKVITNYSLGVSFEGKDIFLSLTEGQWKALSLLGDLKNREFKAVEYENSFGKQVGIRAA